MKVGDLVTHSDMPKAYRVIGVVVETYLDLDICDVVWIDKGCEAFQHFEGSLEIISESR